mmetsp:Transcript_19885/g.59212  ORF Transcript_19885/g.59212 Transcript_19885/m.59212 type:complete len:401 (-) Transcript_19885:24-1226(-)
MSSRWQNAGYMAAGATFGAVAALVIERRRRPVQREGSKEAPPDYRRRGAWYANYFLDGGGNGTRWAPPTYCDAQDRAGCDVFFVHGTTALGPRGCASVRGAEAAEATLFKLARQCSVFTHRCRVFAPRYRQARVGNYHLFEGHAAPDGPTLPSWQAWVFGAAAGAAAFEVAYADVFRALEVFLTKHRKPGRPWILAGHSQGAGHCGRALRALAGPGAPAWAAAALDDLVCALPLGIQHGDDTVASYPLGLASSCRDRGVIAWNTVLPGRRDTYAAGRKRFGYVDASVLTRGPAVSLNPFVVCGGRQGSLCADGVVRQDVFASAAADAGVTIATPREGAEILAWFPLAARDGDLHAYDFECWWAHLRTTIALRLDAFKAARHAKSRKLRSPPGTPLRGGPA